MEYLLIETTEGGVTEWGISTNGPNPEPEHYTPSPSRAVAESVLADLKRGDVMSFLKLSGAVHPEVHDAG